MNDRAKIILGLAIISILVLTALTFVWIFFVRNAVVDYNAPPQIFFPDQGDQSQGRACTEDAKLCPDGSAVGRTGPNCEFAPCPGEK